MDQQQAAKILEYLERQESILGHDNEAYKLHSGANFVLKVLGITKNSLQRMMDGPGLFDGLECTSSGCEKQKEALQREVKRLKSKYEERCWCSARIPSGCGHKSAL